MAKKSFELMRDCSVSVNADTMSASLLFKGDEDSLQMIVLDRENANKLTDDLVKAGYGRWGKHE